ncbi:MAG TPA: hypothetical protein VG502_16215 [Flexivirga sp.]|uniref:hypothetical protein n=1 Tax=Flexivirga sp. TaxID=1962927 RepID=UPI002BE22BB9|nr:hypothetical protein [Flexivirga sp.]HWC23841.1 hypothetical protein [Flexivirga sp.]
MTDQGIAAPTDADDLDAEAVASDLGEVPGAKSAGVELEAVSDEDGPIRRHYEEMKELAADLTIDDLKSGSWFAKLLSHALKQYREKVDSAYFESKYPGMPRDGIVNARIKMAARYAALEGGLSASAYTGAVAATIGSLGGASPITGSAAALSFSADLFSTTTIQLRLAYDIAVLYRVPIDFDDPEDLWRFIRVAFAVKGAGDAAGAATKGVPVVVRPLVKKIYSGATLSAGKSLPVIGKYLLQRNVIKFALPAVGIPLATSMNYWSTKVAGNYARSNYRAEAAVRELARSVVKSSPAHRAALWVAWLVITVDGKINEAETMLMRHLIAVMDSTHDIFDLELREVINVDREFVWSLVEDVPEGRSGLYRLGVAAAEVDGKINSHERKVLAELEARCS